mmetsp:Transcript_40386/g.127835  ORF Transcript_40386/g.127835 Transcript_40386/m.127835 type:complete len:87 (-) Transcript_40386:165-425(-)
MHAASAVALRASRATSLGTASTGLPLLPPLPSLLLLPAPLPLRHIRSTKDALPEMERVWTVDCFGRKFDVVHSQLTVLHASGSSED